MWYVLPTYEEVVGYYVQQFVQVRNDIMTPNYSLRHHPIDLTVPTFRYCRLPGSLIALPVGYHAHITAHPRTLAANST